MPKPTGNLEELFRHHLGEEATVPPRPMLWDQIDNSLLVKQNDVYRRRLTATRWVAAASLLLASLAGTGWWVGRDALLTSSDIAAGIASRTGTTAQETVTSAPAATSRRATGVAPLATASSAVPADGRPGHRPSTSGTSAVASDPAVAATPVASRATGFGMEQAAQLAAEGRSAPVARYGGRQRYQMPAAVMSTPADGAFAAHSATAELNPTSLVAAAAGTGTPNASEHVAATAATSVASISAAASATGPLTAAGGLVATGTATSSLATVLTPAAAEETGKLAARSATLALADAEILPAGLAQVAVPAEVPASKAHRWHYSGSYTAGIFNPNLNFSRAGIEPAYAYNPSPAFGPDSPALTESAATEYRNNLRPGFSQRLALLATRHLQGRWSVSTGVEVSQAMAHSASSSSFVGEQLFDLGQAMNMPSQPLRNTDFRYRLASVPVEVRYSNSVKQGWSFYGRLGGVVSALLGVRSDVEGNPEATRTYSLLSAGSPYRQVLASVRGGAGAQFRTSSGKWALSAGPVADLGLMSLNAHPAQSYFAQSRPYSLGVEAAIEFGR